MNSTHRNRLRALLVGAALAAAIASIPASFGGGPQASRIVLSHGETRYVGPAERRSAVIARRGMKPAVADSARAALARYAPAFGLSDPASQLQQIRSTSRGSRGDVVRYRQLYRGLPVIGGELVLSLDGAGQVLSLSGEVDPKLALADLTPRITGAQAQEIAALATAKYRHVAKSALVADKPELSIFVPRLIGPRAVSPAQLVWRTSVGSRGPVATREFVLVSARTGGLVLHFDQVETARNRNTYTASGGETTPGLLLCDETQPLCTSGANPDADTAHRYAGDMYDFYFARFGRDSFDDLGATLVSTVDYAPPNYCPNAAWIGTQMVYCAGAPAADDVVGHELTHAVTENTSGLFYYYQSGAINESLSDVFGEFMDLSNTSGTDTPEVRWKLGEDFTGVGVIRDMANPAEFGNPDRMGSPDYWTSPDDGGGVHSNSGVNNKAATLIVDGGSFNGYTIAGIGIDKAALIYYRVETQHLTSGSDYADLYLALNEACKNLIGTNGIVANDCQQVANATAAVEMNKEPTLDAGTDVAACGVNEVPVDAYFDGFEGPADPSRWVNTPIVGSSGLWFIVQGFAAQGTQSYYAPGSSQASDHALTMVSSVVVPPNAFLHFRHAFDQESDGSSNYDGGIVEFSTDDGVTWSDASARYSGGQNYNGTIDASTSNPLGGHSAFVGASHGYVSTRYDLGALAGSNLRVRFRNSSDFSLTTGLSWLVDDVRIYTCATDTSANTPPAAAGGVDQLVAPRDVVTLDGSGSSDADGFIATSSWTQLSGTAVNATSVGRSLTFAAPSTPTQDVLVFRLTVTDNRGVTATDDVSVTVVNAQPQAAAGSDQSSKPRTLVSLHGAATDTNGTIASYRWTQTSGPTALLGKVFTTPVFVSSAQSVSVGTGPIAVGTAVMQLNFPPAELTSAGGTVTLNSNSFYTVCTTVTAGSCGWVSSTQLGITGSVTAPASTGGAMTWTLQGVQLSDGTPVQGSFKFDPGTLTLSAISIIAVTETSKDVSFSAPSVPTTADLVFHLAVTDNDGGTGSDDVTVQVTNAQPTADAGADQSLHPRVAATLSGGGADPDGSIVAYAWTQTAGPAVTITNASSASASIVTPSVAASTTLTFQLTTTDNDGGTASDTMNVAVTNSVPTVSAGNDMTVNAGAMVSLAATATDSDGSIGSYNWTQSAGSPVTLTGNTTSTAQFRAPSLGTQSTYSFQVSVTDTDGASATDTVTVTVRASSAGSSSGGGGGGGGGAFDALTLGALLTPLAIAWTRRRRRFARP